MDSTTALCMAPDGTSDSIIQAAMNTLECSRDDMTVSSTDSAPEGKLFQAVAVIISEESNATMSMVTKALHSLQKGGRLVVMAPAAEKNGIRKSAMMAGSVQLSVDMIIVAEQHFTVVVGKKPNFDTGAKATIKVPAPQASSVWKIGSTMDDDLIDEDDLLTEEDRKPVLPDAGGCATSKKACANCSCGRAEAEAAGVKVTLTQEMIENPQSACGSCGMGDAFRCATCPYRGLPSFQPGKKIEISSDFLVADA